MGTEEEMNGVRFMAKIKSNTELFQIEDLCRLCMKKATEPWFVIDEEGDQVSELRYICEVLLQSKVDFSSTFLNKICEQCVADLDVCQRMMEQLKNANSYLNAIEKHSLFIKGEPLPESSDYESQNDTSTTFKVPRGACVMTIETFLSEFEDAEKYLNESELDDEMQAELQLKTEQSGDQEEAHNYSEDVSDIETIDVDSDVAGDEYDILAEDADDVDYLPPAKHGRRSRQEDGQNINTILNPKKKPLENEKLTRHSGSKHDLSLECQICGKEYKSTYQRRMHQCTAKKKKLEVCWYCGKHVSASIYTKHLLRHLNKFDCQLCGKNFKTQSALVFHKWTHEEEIAGAKKKFTCKTCRKKFMTNEERDEHALSHLPFELRKPLQCRFCGKRFSLQQSLDTHEKIRINRGGTCPLKCIRGVVEVKEKAIHPCDVCQRLFIKPENVERHRKYHFCDGDKKVLNKLLEEPEVHKCQDCDIYMFSKITWQYHMAKHTGDPLPFKCDFCSRKCKSHHEIKIHERDHTGERPYSCQLCGQTFKALKTCQAHEDTHNTKEAFPCPDCHKSFKSRKQLSAHSRIHHEESLERPYACNLCNRYFIAMKDLEIHTSKYHSNKFTDQQLTPEGGGYACGECGKAFAQESYCRKHLRIVHGYKFPRGRKAAQERENQSETIEINTMDNSKDLFMDVEENIPEVTIESD